MATGFTREKATSILSSALSGCYVALSTTTPNELGTNFTEPPTSTGYQRQSIGALDTSKEGQVANKERIFLFEALEDVGSITHVCLSSFKGRGEKIFLMAEVNPPLTVDGGFVPLIRPYGLVIGLDKDVLEGYENVTT